MDLTINSIYGKQVSNVLNTTGMLMNSTGFKTFLALAATIGFIYFLSRYIKGAAKFSQDSKTYIAVWAIVAVGFLTKSDFIVYDIPTGKNHIVHDVPLGVGLVSSSLSSVGYSTAGAYTQAFSNNVSSIDSYSLENGYLGPIKYLYLLRNISQEQNPIEKTAKGKAYKNNIFNYVKDCYLPFQDLKKNSDIYATTTNSEDLWGSLKIDNYAWTTIYYSDAGEPNPETCTTAYNNITSFLESSDFSDEMLNYLANVYLSSNNLDNPAIDASIGTTDIKSALKKEIVNSINSLLNQSAQSIFDTSTSSDNKFSYSQDNKALHLMRNLYVFRSMISATHAYWTRNPHSNAAQAMLMDGMANKNISMANTSFSFVQYFKPVLGFIEGFVYAIAPIALFILLAQGEAGMKVVGMYILVFFWISLWPVSFVFVNDWVMDDFVDKVNLLVQAGSVSEIGRALRAAENSLGAGGTWVGMVPLLSLFMVTGSIYTLTSIGNRLVGSEFMNESNMNRATFNPSAMYNLKGSEMNADTNSPMAKLANTKNADLMHSQDGYTVNSANTVNSEIAQARQMLIGANQTYDKATGAVFSTAAGIGSNSSNKVAFGMDTKDGVTTGDGTSFKDMSQAADTVTGSGNEQASQAAALAAMAKIGAGMSGGFQVPVNKAQAAAINADAAAKGFVKPIITANAEGSFTMSAQDARAYAAAYQISDTNVDSLSQDKAFQKALSEGVSLRYDQDYAQTRKSDDNVRLEEGYKESLTLQQQAQSSYQNATRYANSVGSGTQMDESQFLVYVTQQMQHNTQLSRSYENLRTDPRVQSTAQEIQANPTFQATFANATYDENGDGVATHQEAVEMASTLRAMRETGHFDDFAQQVFAAGAVRGASPETLLSKEDQDRAEQTEHKIDELIKKAEDQKNKQIDPKMQQIRDESARVEKEFRDGKYKVDDELMPVINSQHKDILEHFQVKSLTNIPAKDLYAYADQLLQFKKDDAEFKFQEEYENSEIVKNAGKAREIAKELNLDPEHVIQGASHSAMLYNPIVQKLVDEIPPGPDKTELLEAREALSKEIKSGDGASVEEITSFLGSMGKSAVLSVMGYSPSEVLHDFYDTHKSELTPEQREQYHKDLEYIESHPLDTEKWNELANSLMTNISSHDEFDGQGIDGLRKAVASEKLDEVVDAGQNLLGMDAGEAAYRASALISHMSGELYDEWVNGDDYKENMRTLGYSEDDISQAGSSMKDFAKAIFNTPSEMANKEFVQLLNKQIDAGDKIDPATYKDFSLYDKIEYMAQHGNYEGYADTISYLKSQHDYGALDTKESQEKFANDVLKEAKRVTDHGQERVSNDIWYGYTLSRQPTDEVFTKLSNQWDGVSNDRSKDLSALYANTEHGSEQNMGEFYHKLEKEFPEYLPKGYENMPQSEKYYQLMKNVLNDKTFSSKDDGVLTQIGNKVDEVIAANVHGTGLLGNALTGSQKESYLHSLVDKYYKDYLHQGNHPVTSFARFSEQERMNWVIGNMHDANILPTDGKDTKAFNETREKLIQVLHERFKNAG